eukprot:TRINITY_DN2832_c0_g1_i4.p1 TRINITY_DN2832_c0_g1~~TRINITY_DN2832_c0_g1_i4.p1  ORF type:complete len:263 (+),score=40.29 TRINITY_DN2832_c0_g1_i4:50-838(+)
MLKLIGKMQGNSMTTQIRNMEGVSGGLCYRKCNTLRRQNSKQFYSCNKHRKFVRTNVKIVSQQRDEPVIAPVIPMGMEGEEMQYMDLNRHMLDQRILFVQQRINDEVATSLCAKMLALEVLDENKDIRLYINSMGGSSYSVLSIIDMMQAIKPDVQTIAIGACTSNAALLLASGAKGKRFSMPHARIMINQPIGGVMGSADEVNITATELNRTMKVIHRFYSQFTGLSIEKVEEETDRDNFMSPEQAVEFGIIDGVIPCDNI